jgi:hypothetical protein
MTDARTGWGGEVHISTDETAGNLVELVEVVSFETPQDESEEVDATHLKSPDRRREVIAGLIDGGSSTITLNCVPGSATYNLLLNAQQDGTTRAVRLILPDQAGDPDWQIDTFGWVKRFTPGTITANGKIEATAVLRITGAQTQAAVA